MKSYNVQIQGLLDQICVLQDEFSDLTQQKISLDEKSNRKTEQVTRLTAKISELELAFGLEQMTKNIAGFGFKVENPRNKKRKN